MGKFHQFPSGSPTPLPLAVVSNEPLVVETQKVEIIEKIVEVFSEKVHITLKTIPVISEKVQINEKVVQVEVLKPDVSHISDQLSALAQKVTKIRQELPEVIVRSVASPAVIPAWVKILLVAETLVILTQSAFLLFN